MSVVLLWGWVRLGDLLWAFSTRGRSSVAPECGAASCGNSAVKGAVGWDFEEIWASSSGCGEEADVTCPQPVWPSWARTARDRLHRRRPSRKHRVSSGQIALRTGSDGVYHRTDVFLCVARVPVGREASLAHECVVVKQFRRQGQGPADIGRRWPKRCARSGQKAANTFVAAWLTRCSSAELDARALARRAQLRSLWIPHVRGSFARRVLARLGSLGVCAGM